MTPEKEDELCKPYLDDLRSGAGPRRTKALVALNKMLQERKAARAAARAKAKTTPAAQPREELERDARDLGSIADRRQEAITGASRQAIATSAHTSAPRAVDMGDRQIFTVRGAR